MPLIKVKNLTKEFKVYKRKKGFLGSLQNLFSRKHTIIKAVNNISFEVEKGDIIGYIGPNGAGKSTTVKMLTGILVPTSGGIEVRGLIPYKRRKENAKRIGVVFGQRTQLWWDLPVIESFELLKHIYKVPDSLYKENMEIFTELLDLNKFINTPVRKLSLGQKMRSDIAASLLHSPDILYLDEPTIGLDIMAKEKIRDFIKKINKERKVTVILTTHDLIDVERVCPKIMIIDQGKIIYNGSINKIKQRFGKFRTLVVDLNEDHKDFKVGRAELVKRKNRRLWLKFNREKITASKLISKITGQYDIKDLTIEEPEIESIVKKIYEEGL